MEVSLHVVCADVSIVCIHACCTYTIEVVANGQIIGYLVLSVNHLVQGLESKSSCVFKLNAKQGLEVVRLHT